MQRILVTGGAGFIGSHTSLLLIEKGYEILIVDSLINSSIKLIKRINKIIDIKFPKMKNKLTFIKGDLRDESIVNEIFLNQYKIGKPITGVIHFAGLKAVNESIYEPLKYWDFNLVSTINLLKVMNLFECRTIVFSSSAAVYGSPKKNFLKEEDKLDPINPYGLTKSTIEKILDNLYKSSSNKWKIINLRYFNPIGAHTSGLIGEVPKGIPNNIFPLIMQVASGNIEILKIYGNDWPTNDGTPIRDYIHVMDLANGHLYALEHLLKNSSKILNLNIGTGIGSSVLELIRTFEKVNKINVPFKFSDRRDGDAAIVVADNSLVKNILNWKPTRNIEDMCRDGWQWQRKNPNLF
tara:strand:- start:454 stop:1506 length:1053 start_codon:yes stop_codon:yes gene_type:complete